MKVLALVTLTAALVGCASNNSESSNVVASEVESSQLSRDEVKSAIRGQTSAFRICYEQYAKANGAFGKSGKLNFKWVVEPTGKVVDVLCDENSFGDSNFENCMKKVISSIQFPPKFSLTKVNYPFVFKGKD